MVGSHEEVDPCNAGRVGNTGRRKIDSGRKGEKLRIKKDTKKGLL